MAEETDVGSIVAHLRLDVSDWKTNLAEAQRQAEELGKVNPDIRVRVTDAEARASIEHMRGELGKLQAGDYNVTVRVKTAEATAQLAALRAELAALKSEANTSPSGGGGPSSGGGGGPGLLVTGILSALPLIGPLAGAGTSAMGSLAGMVGVTGLAWKGFNNEMAAGTALGAAVDKQIDSLSGSVAKLESTAARGSQGGVLSGLKQINTFMPTLTPLVGILSHDLGQAFSVGTGGLISALRTAEPLLLDGGKYAEELATNLAHAGSSPQFASFIAYSRRELPIVVHTVEELTTAGVHLVEGLAPLGTVVLASLNGISLVLKDIPVPVLTALAAGAMATYVAFKGLAIIEGVNLYLTNYAKKAIVAAGASDELAAANARASVGAGSMAAKFGPALGYAAATVVILGTVRALDNYIDRNNSEVRALKNSTAAQQAYTTALTESKGVIDSNVLGAIALQLQQDGLSKKALQAGISQDQLIAGITSSKGSYVDASGQIKNYAGSLNDVIDKWKASGKPSHDTIKALQEVSTEFRASKAATDAYLAAQLKFAGAEPVQYAALATTAASLSTLASQYKLTTGQVQTYAGVLGITSDEITNGTVTNGQLARAVREVSKAYDTATTSGTEYLAALTSFSTSAGTSADRAALIGATLKAANGDALGYASSMVTAATANQTFVTAFDNARTAAGKAHLAFNDAKAGVVDLTHGTLNYHNAAAGPLIQDLQAMQTAAMQAAGATYQHELATAGAAKASQHAVDVYRAQTAGALVAEAKQLGLTSTQAQTLAGKYFALPKDITTQIKAIGTDPVVTILDKIGAMLAHLTGQPWVSTIGVTGAAAAVNQILAVRTQLQLLNGSTATVNVTTVTSQHGAFGGRQALADGGEVRGPGTGTSDSVAAVNQSTGGAVKLSNGEFVETAAATSRNRAALEAANRGATLGIVHSTRQAFADGGFVGVTAPVPKASGTGKAKKAKTAKPVNVPLVVTVGGGSAYGISSYIKGQIPSAAAATRDLSLAVNAAFQMRGALAQVASLKAQLVNLRQEKAAYQGGVTSSLMGQVDFTKYGDAQMLADALSAGRQASAKFTGEGAKLAAEHIPDALIRILTQNGPNAGLDTVAGLAPGSAMLRQIVGQFQAYAGAANRGGVVAGSAAYDSQIRATATAASRAAIDAAHDRAVMLRALAVLGKLVQQPSKIVMDGKEVAHVVIASKEFNGVIDDLTGHLVLGRRP